MSEINSIDWLVEISAEGLKTTLQAASHQPQVIGTFNRLVEEAGVVERNYQQLRLVLAGTDGLNAITNPQKLALYFIQHQNPEDLRKVGVLARAYAGVFRHVNAGYGGGRVQKNLLGIFFYTKKVAATPLPPNSAALFEGAASRSITLSGILTRLRGLPICIALVGLATFDHFILPYLFEENAVHKAMNRSSSEV